MSVSPGLSESVSKLLETRESWLPMEIGDMAEERLRFVEPILDIQDIGVSVRVVSCFSVVSKGVGGGGGVTGVSEGKEVG